MKNNAFWIIACSVIAALAYLRGYDRGQYIEHLETIKAIAKQNQKADVITEIVYKTQIESQVVYVDRIKKVKEYVKQKVDYSDTRCIPTAGLRAYNASLYNPAAESTGYIDVELYSSTANSNTDN